MAEKDPLTASAEAAAKELVKTAYGDLMQPAAREIGAELGEFVRAIIIAGRGFGALIRETYKPFVLRALAGIPVERRIPPPPSLLGQILEGISYEQQGTPLYEMFESLLAGAMDSQRMGNAHPSFAPIIRSISRDEAFILKHLKSNLLPVFNESPNIIHIGIYDNNQYDASGMKIDLVDNMAFYVEHLYTLGLLAWEHARQHEEESNGIKGSRSFLGLSIMGRSFVKACMPSGS